MIPNTSSKPDRLNILVVDDVESNRDLVAASLVELSAEVTFASNGLEALALVGRHRFHLIFTDLQMPEMDGLEAVTLIRQLPKGRDVPIIAITGSDLDEVRQRCMDAGFNDVAFKPINRKQLMPIAIKWLQAAREPRSTTPRD